MFAAGIPEIKHRIQERFRVFREDEDKCVVMQLQMDDMQDQAEEMLEQKDIECHQIIEQVQTECQTMFEEKEREAEDGKFSDCKSDEGPTILEETKIGKFRNSLGAGVADRTDAGRMVLTYGQSTKTMTRNVNRDKEQESNVQAIVEGIQLMEVPVSVG